MKKILGSTFLLFILSLISNNLTFAEETSILSGIPIQGKITSMETIDVYRFTTTKDGGEVYITLDEATGGFSMNLYDENENYVEGDYFSTKGNKIVINENLQQGTYFIKIKPYRWDGITSASYRLKATYASSFERNSKTFEPNDTVETSLSIKSGNFYKSKSETEIDKDVYQFTTSKDGEVFITLDETTGGFSMNLYDANGTFIEGDYFSTKGNKIVLNENVKKGTYYIKITPYRWNGITSATYRLKATYASSFKRNTKTFETNDTFETSMSISSNKFYQSNSYSDIDRDVYRFRTKRDGNATITLDKTTGGFSMNLYDANGTYIEGDYFSTKGNKIVLNENVKKGTYYIRITPYRWNGITSAKYRLKATYKSK